MPDAGVNAGVSAPHSPNSLTPPLHTCSVGELRLVLSSGAISIEAPRGWRDRALVQRDIAAIRPALLRALAPDLPPFPNWPAQWVEAWEARAQVHREAGSEDESAAYDDLRVAVWSGTVANLIPRFSDNPATLGPTGPQWWAE